ncbi:DUF551 domain-containing protein [Citrobacter freundii]
MSTLTKEWLKELAAGQSGFNLRTATPEESMELARIALASLEADGALANEGTITATQFKPVADLYGLTSPTGGETSFTFDAVEARDFIDGGWSCQEYVELGRFQEVMLQNGNSPAQDGNYPVVPDGWVACSERMPETMVSVLVTGTWFHHSVAFWDGLSWCDLDFEQPVTHWMPLPAAPQQE